MTTEMEKLADELYRLATVNGLTRSEVLEVLEKVTSRVLSIPVAEVED